jgi:hypothetical protein
MQWLQKTGKYRIDALGKHRDSIPHPVGLNSARAALKTAQQNCTKEILNLAYRVVSMYRLIRHV